MLRVVETFADICDLYEWAAKQPCIAVDTETTGKGVFDPNFRVRLVQFGNITEAWVVPLEDWVGPVKAIIERCPRVLMHNSAYDIAALMTHGIVVPWERVDDTMIAMRLAEPHLRAGLKEAATRHISAAAANSQKELHTAMRRNGWDWATVPIDFPPYRYYAAMDVILTSRLAQREVCKNIFRLPIYRLEMDVRKACSTMERNGIRVDLPFCQQTIEELTEKIETIRMACMEDYGFTVSSNADLGRALIEHGAPLTELTPSGKPSVTKEALEIAKHEATGDAARIVDLALDFRKASKLVASYFTNFRDLSDPDGLLHPSIETVAARTGRMSIRSPALQTLPRGDDPEAKMVRRAVQPRYEDEVLLSCDYSQIELRLIASYSGDTALQEAFHISDAPGSDADFFTAATRLVYNDPSMPKSDPRRTGVKTLFYASAYGAGTAKMALTAGIPFREMDDLADKVFKRYPGIKKLMKEAEQRILKNSGWLTTPHGRSIYVDPERGYAAMNGLIQGSAADIFKTAVVELAHAGLEEKMVVVVHDEVLFSLKPDEVEDAKDTIRDVMTRRDYPVPLLAEPSEKGALYWSEVEK